MTTCTHRPVQQGRACVAMVLGNATSPKEGFPSTRTREFSVGFSAHGEEGEAGQEDESATMSRKLE